MTLSNLIKNNTYVQLSRNSKQCRTKRLDSRKDYTMKALVLGAAGFIGRNLLQSLHSSNCQIIAYDKPRNFGLLKQCLGDMHLIGGDFSNENRWDELLVGVDVCYHLISVSTPKSSNDDPISDVSGNVIGTLRLLESAKKHRVRIVFVSSGGTVYGAVDSSSITEDHPTNPLCSYGITKLTIEKYLLSYRELYGLHTISLRVANPYGSWQNPNALQGAIGVFIGRALRGEIIDIWGNGSVIRDYIYISDVTNALMMASHYDGQHHVFNIGSGQGTSLLDILKMIEQIIGSPIKIDYHPARAFDVKKNVLSVQKAKNELLWSPQISLAVGLENTIAWMRRHFGW